MQPARVSRRAMLKGSGVALALPLLECMAPAAGVASPTPSGQPRRLVAIDEWQLDVHQDQIRLLALCHSHSFLAIDGLNQLEADRVQKVAHDRAIVLLVLDDENALGHAAPAR